MGIKILKYIFVLLGIIVFFVSCKDEEKSELRNFMPVNISVSTDGVNTATLSWQPVRNAVSYTIYIYSNQEKTELVSSQIVTSDTCAISDLVDNQTYYYKICANNSNPELNSKWQEGDFTFKRDKLFNTPIVEIDSVILSWNKVVATLTSIVLVNNTTNTIVYLTSKDIVDQKIVLNNLLESSKYDAKIYIGTTLIDEVSFTTKAKSSSKDIYVSSSDNLIDIINNCESGSIIHLSAGIYAYGDKEIVIDGKSIYLESSSSNEDSLPEIHIRCISLKGNVGNVSIKNLALSGFALGGKSPTEKNDYFIDMNSDFISADSIRIEGCTIHYLENCAIRGSRGLGNQNVNYIGFVNCVLTDINSEGNEQYEIFKLDSLQLGSFQLNNCIIYNTSHGILNNRNNYNPALQIEIKNCTINDVGSTKSTPKKYLIECSNCIGIFDFENNIISNLKGFSTNESYMSKGFNLGKCTSTANNNLFYNIPFTVQEATEWTSATDNLDDIDPLYSDAEIGDFSIGNTTIQGKRIGFQK